MHKKLFILFVSYLYIFSTQQANAITEAGLLAERIKAIQSYRSDVCQAALLADRSKVLQSYGNRIHNLREDLILGNPHASHTIIEFFDYNSPDCKQSAAEIEALVAKHKDLRVILKDLDIAGNDSMFIHLISRAFHALYPNKQRQFWHEMMNLPELATETSTLTIAARLGANTNSLQQKFNEDLAGKENLRGYLRENENLSILLQIYRLPCYIVNNKIYEGIVDLEMLAAEARKN